MMVTIHDLIDLATEYGEDNYRSIVLLVDKGNGIPVTLNHNCLDVGVMRMQPNSPNSEPVRTYIVITPPPGD